MDVKPRTWDLVGIPSVVKFLHAFFTGRDVAWAAKTRAPGRKVIGMSPAMVVPELAVACGGIPLGTARCGAFTYMNSDALLRRITRTVKTAGWATVEGMLKLACFSRTGADVVDYLVDNLLVAFETSAGACVAQGARLGLGRGCMDTRWVAGVAAMAAPDVDAAIEIPLHPCAREPAFATITSTILPNHHSLVLHGNDGHPASTHIVEDRLVRVMDHLARITGTRVSEDTLARAIEQANAAKTMVREMTHVLARAETLPGSPGSIAHLQRLMSMALVDLNSNPVAFLANLGGMLRDTRERVERGQGMDAREFPTLLAVPGSAVLDPAAIRAATAAGARIIPGGFELSGVLDPVPKRGPVASLASHLVRCASLADETGDVLARRIVDCARDLGAAGVLVQQGCINQYDDDLVEALEHRAGSFGIPVVCQQPPGIDLDGAMLATSMIEYTTYMRMA